MKKKEIQNISSIYPYVLGTLDPEELAKRIEKRLYEIHKSIGDKYKAALRSRVFNLRDKKNQALRENVLTGAVQPEKFAVMTTEEMACAEMKKTREAFTKESIMEYQMSVQEGLFVSFIFIRGKILFTVSQMPYHYFIFFYLK